MTVTFTLTDGQLGDATAADGMIIDPSGPAVPGPNQVPVVSNIGLLLAAMLLILVGISRLLAR